MGYIDGPNPRGRPKGKGISSYLRDLLEEQDPVTNQPKNKLIAKLMIDIALDPKTAKRDALMVCEAIINRLEGKPVNTNLNADIGQSPFDGIDTANLEALRAKLKDVCLKKEEPKPEEPK